MPIKSNYEVFKESVVRIYAANNMIVGAGFLVSDRHIMTCAHIITQALNLPQNYSDLPSGSITLDFPFISSRKLIAKVVFWRPVQPMLGNSSKDGEDIAGLELESLPSEINQPIQLVSATGLREHTFQVYGFPKGHFAAVEVCGVFHGAIANGWIQLESNGSYSVEPGFSGAPVWDDSLEGVVGMIVAREKQRVEVKAAFMVPTQILSSAWNQVSQFSEGIAAYRVKAEELIFRGYGRSGKIDPWCRECLEGVKQSIEEQGLELSVEQAFAINNEILSYCESVCSKVQVDMRDFQHKVAGHCDIDPREMLKDHMSSTGSTGLTPESESLTLASLGNESLKVGNLSKAVILFEKILSFDSASISAHTSIAANISLGGALLGQDKFKEALKKFEQARDLCKEREGMKQQAEELEKIIQQTKRMDKNNDNLTRVSTFLPPITRTLSRYFQNLRSSN